jgi:hypothetical protein
MIINSEYFYQNIEIYLPLVQAPPKRKFLLAYRKVYGAIDSMSYEPKPGKPIGGYILTGRLAYSYNPSGWEVS